MWMSIELKQDSFITLFLFLIPYPPLLFAEQLYHTESIEVKAGIFFHHIGTAKISHDSFTLLSYTNISIYEEKLNLIHNTYQKSEQICKMKQDTFSHEEFLCRERLEWLHNQINTLNEKFDSLSHLTSHETSDLTNKRFKRGLFDGVSYAFKWLFGTPDAEDAKYYTEAIESICQQNHESNLLMKHQVHIMSDAISNYNKTAQGLLLNEQKLNDNVNKFNNFARNVTDRVNSLTFTQTKIGHFNLLSQIISELNEELDQIISAILFSKQNTLHPSVITPRHLYYELLKIKINSNFEFPIDNNNIEGIHKYLQICQLSVIYSNKNLIYAIKIPLVTKELYQLYNLVPLPTKSLNSTSIYSFINPNFPYLLLSTTRTFYGELKDLSTCKWMPPSDYICSRTTVYLVKERPTCEVDLKLRQPKTIPKDCSTKTIKSEMEIWHPLSPNQWLYILTQPVAGTISCENSNSPIVDFSLQGTGIFTLKSKCKCYTLSTLLIASSNMSANYSNFVPSNVDIVNDDCCQKQQEFLKIEEMDTLKLNNLNLNDLRHVEHKLQQFDDELQRKIDQPFIIHKSKWYNVLLGTIVLLMLILVFCWGCCRCCRWKPLSWFRKFWGPDNCRYMICINSHNTVSNNDLSSWNTHRSLQNIDTGETILEDTPLNTPDEPIYAELSKPKEMRKSKRLFKI